MKRTLATKLRNLELALLLLAALTSACVEEPSYDGRLCAASGDCPDGYSCGPDLRCHSIDVGESQDPGQLPSIDAGVAAGDGGVAAGDASAMIPATPDAGAVATSTIPSPLAKKNPFVEASLNENPDFSRGIDRSIAAVPPTERAALAPVRSFSTAVWISRIGDLSTVAGHLAAADAQAARDKKPVAIVFVLNDFPNRNCPTNDGELRVAEDGVARYEAEVVEPFAVEVAKHPDLRVVVILEPGALPHMITGGGIPSCAAVAPAHRALLVSTIDRLSKLAQVSIYLEVAHGSWLGWPDHRRHAATLVRELFRAGGGAKKVRGFAVNVANFNVLEAQPELFEYGTNPCHDERTYMRLLAEDLAVEGITGANFLVDTSRNGRAGIRRLWEAYCNVRGAGLGERPRAEPAPGIDAYFWVKMPGESDGTTDPASPTFNPECAREDSAPSAPEAGDWFHMYFLELIRNAVPPL